VLRQALAARARRAGRTAGDLWRLAGHPRQSFADARASADIFRDLCQGGLVVSTGFPTAEPIADAGERDGVAQPVALRTVLQIDGHVALLIDQGLAYGDQRLLRALMQVHSGAVQAALAPLVRAQAIAAALRASLRVAAPASGLGATGAAYWLSSLLDALLWGAATATLTGTLLFSARWTLETYMRRKARSLLKG
jgi:hypothetical protein